MMTGHFTICQTCVSCLSGNFSQNKEECLAHLTEKDSAFTILEDGGFVVHYHSQSLPQTPRATLLEL